MNEIVPAAIGVPSIVTEPVAALLVTLAAVNPVVPPLRLLTVTLEYGMLPPVTVSLPFKLIFFVLVDGWNLVAGSLVQSFGT